MYRLCYVNFSMTVVIPAMWTYLTSNCPIFVWFVCFMSAYFNWYKWFYINIRKKILAIFNHSGVVLLPCVNVLVFESRVCLERVIGLRLSNIALTL